MNPRRRQKHYGGLSIGRRLSLLVAAAARDDQEELRALLDSAPRRTFSVPHTYGRAQALAYVADRYVMKQLASAANLLFLAHADAEPKVEPKRRQKLFEAEQVGSYVLLDEQQIESAFADLAARAYAAGYGDALAIEERAA